MERLRRRCERHLEGVHIPNPFNLDELCEGIASLRGRRLELRAVPGLSSTAPCGLWISIPAADYIFFEPNTSRLHAEHIVLHELGHMLGGHSIAADVESSTLSRLMPDLDSRTIARVMGRVSYSTSQEQEAEMLASLIWARADRGRPRASVIDSRRDALGRLADILSRL